MSALLQTPLPNGPLVQVSHLSVDFGRGAATNAAVRDISFALRAGEILALVGESGSGKSVTGRALLGLAGAGARVTAETLEIEGAFGSGRFGAAMAREAWPATRARAAGRACFARPAAAGGA